MAAEAAAIDLSEVVAAETAAAAAAARGSASRTEWTAAQLDMRLNAGAAARGWQVVEECWDGAGASNSLYYIAPSGKTFYNRHDALTEDYRVVNARLCMAARKRVAATPKATQVAAGAAATDPFDDEALAAIFDDEALAAAGDAAPAEETTLTEASEATHSVEAGAGAGGSPAVLREAAGSVEAARDAATMAATTAAATKRIAANNRAYAALAETANFTEAPEATRRAQPSAPPPTPEQFAAAPRTPPQPPLAPSAAPQPRTLASPSRPDTKLVCRRWKFDLFHVAPPSALPSPSPSSLCPPPPSSPPPKPESPIQPLPALLPRTQPPPPPGAPPPLLGLLVESPRTPPPLSVPQPKLSSPRVMPHLPIARVNGFDRDASAADPAAAVQPSFDALLEVCRRNRCERETREEETLYAERQWHAGEYE